MPGAMNAAPGHRRERRGSFHVRAGAAGKRAPPSLVLVCCIGAIALLATSGRTLAVTDGDTITVYVNVANHPESVNVPQEVRKAATERIKAQMTKNYQQADALQKIMKGSGYRFLT
nr:unnamed protein product [Digitaria exilis]